MEEGTSRLRSCRDARGKFGLDRVANAKPERLLVWRRLIYAALHAGKAHDRRQILAHALAIQTLAEVRIKRELIALSNRSVNQIVDEFLTSLAVHCLPPSFCLISTHKSNEN